MPNIITVKGSQTIEAPVEVNPRDVILHLRKVAVQTLSHSRPEELKGKVYTRAWSTWLNPETGDISITEIFIKDGSYYDTPDEVVLEVDRTEDFSPNLLAYIYHLDRLLGNSRL
ncbi:hypothetical protein NVP1121O_150 [Vibrio phage 1.121.O._10N.286.46.C4]|nr:hypothetical protein NVP1121O_150 [Vibrio phage 1.121.O._10N.286.46.C4]